MIITGFGFVDDIDLIQKGIEREEYWDVAHTLHAAVKLWGNSTEVSGGCLVPEKSWWTLVDFTWNEGKWEYTSDMDDVGLYLKDVAGVDRKLVQLTSWEAHTILGV